MELVFIRENTSKKLLFRIDSLGYHLSSDIFAGKDDQGQEDGQTSEGMSHPIFTPTRGLSSEHDLNTPSHSQLSHQLDNAIKDTQAQGFDFVRDSLPMGIEKAITQSHKC